MGVLAPFGIPTGGVIDHDGIDREVGGLERQGRRPAQPTGGSAAVTAGPVTEAGNQLVGAAGGTTETALEELVGHGVGQRLHGVTTADGVAVNVDEGVELVEAEASVAPEEGQTGGSQRTSTETFGRIVQRWQRRLIVVRWAAASAPVDSRPQAIAGLAELVDDRVTAGHQSVELVVDRRTFGEQRFAAGVQAFAPEAVDAGGIPNRELAVRANGM